MEKHAHPPRVVYCAIYSTQSLVFEICILQALHMPLIRCTNVFFQRRLSRHITSPSEKTRPESWPGDNMGKATPVWQLSLSHRCHQMQRTAEQSHIKPRRWKSMLIHQGWFTALNTQHLLDSQSFEFEICILQALNMPLIRCTNVFFSKGGYPVT